MKEYLKRGFLEKSELASNFPPRQIIEKHSVAMTECVQEIPCNPCVTACPVGAISMADINSIPKVNFETCIGCGKCVAVCPGLAMFMMRIDERGGEVTLPYEMLPVPVKGETVNLLNRSGEIVSKGTVSRVISANGSIKSSIVTVRFKDPELVYEVRNIEVIR
ncbi:MAG: 4Fe-4S binding protein [Caldisericaceae bacterium]